MWFPMNKSGNNNIEIVEKYVYKVYEMQHSEDERFIYGW